MFAAGGRLAVGDDSADAPAPSTVDVEPGLGGVGGVDCVGGATTLLDEQADGEGGGENRVYIWIGKVTGNSLKAHEEWEGEGVGRVFIPYSAAVSVKDVLDRIRLACRNEPHTLVA